jgi:hypothetical protein
MLSGVEMGSLLCIGVSLNLSLLFEHFTEESSPGLFWATIVAIFAINVAVFAAFAVAVAIAARRRVKGLIASDPRKWAALRPLVEPTLGAMERKTDSLVASHANHVAELTARNGRLCTLADMVAELEADAYIEAAAVGAIRELNVYLSTAVLRLDHPLAVIDDFEELLRVERQVFTEWHRMASAEQMLLQHGVETAW